MRRKGKEAVEGRSRRKEERQWRIEKLGNTRGKEEEDEGRGIKVPEGRLQHHEI